MVVSGSWRSFLYSSSVYSCHLLVSSASVRSIPFLSFIEPIFAWNVPLVSLIFLKRSLVFPILLFSSISWHWSLEEGFLISPCYLELCIQMGVSFLFSFALSFSSFLSYLEGLRQPFCLFFFLRMLLITASCTMSWTSVHSSSGTLSIDLIPWIYLSLLYKQEIWLRSYLNDLVIFPTFFKSEFGNKIELMFWGTVSSLSCFCWLYRASPLDCKEYNQSDFGIDHLVLSMCSLLVLLEEGVCYDKCILLAKLLAFALLHFVLPGQICVTPGISLDFLLLHSSPL